ncbi:MAG: alpha/beta fold hydrolase [Candidatus Eisenbacteria bacterium]|uniref:Alpha/beta fold hydrolase n=1 Tax=Eiseniibacteriota bacterium TaxID=2212470 RepID=A0A538UEH0_UNCEI|nr:MAG: alpha/beta fold hydrolase [Candidatus Eisenbacteria bacterium]
MSHDQDQERPRATPRGRRPGLGNVVVLAASALALFVVGSIWLALFPPVIADLGGAPDLDAVATRVRIPIGDDALSGWLVPGSRPALVIVFHGYARDHRRAWRYASFLHRAGYSVLAVDFRSSRERGRKPTTLGVYEMQDATATLAWARRNPRTRDDTLGLLGESLGASVALVLAARHPEVAAVVADCPFASGEWAMEDGAMIKLHLPKWPTAVLGRGLGRLLTGADPWGLDVAAAADSLQDRPVFLIHAQGDDRFSTEQTEAIWRAAGSHGELWLAGGDHNQAWQRHRTEYERRVLAFFARSLNGSPHHPVGESVAGAARDGTKPAGSRRGAAGAGTVTQGHAGGAAMGKVRGQ